MLIISLALTIQHPTFFDAILDVAAVNHAGNNHHAGSRTNSLEPPGTAVPDGKDHPGAHHPHRGSRDQQHDDSAFDILAAAEQRRQRSIRFVIAILTYLLARVLTRCTPISIAGERERESQSQEELEI